MMTIHTKKQKVNGIYKIALMSFIISTSAFAQAQLSVVRNSTAISGGTWCKESTMTVEPEKRMLTIRFNDTSLTPGKEPGLERSLISSRSCNILLPIDPGPGMQIEVSNFLVGRGIETKGQISYWREFYGVELNNNPLNLTPVLRTRGAIASSEFSISDVVSPQRAQAARTRCGEKAIVKLRLGHDIVTEDPSTLPELKVKGAVYQLHFELLACR